MSFETYHYNSDMEDEMKNPHDEPGDIYDEIDQERGKQKAWGSDEFDKGNSKNDWIAYIASYVGDAADKVKKKELQGLNEEQRFRKNMVKVAALAVAAIEARDKGLC